MVLADDRADPVNLDTVENSQNGSSSPGKQMDMSLVEGRIEL